MSYLFSYISKRTILSVKVALSLASKSFGEHIFKSMPVHPSVNVYASSQPNLFEYLKLLCLYLIMFSDHVLAVLRALNLECCAHSTESLVQW